MVNVASFAIDALIASALLAFWYWAWVEYNRRRARRVLEWVQAACLGKARVLQTRWANATQLQARVAFSAEWLENARLTVELLPRPIPLKWLLSLCRHQKETLTFEADLDYVPGFNLEIYRHRWMAHTGKAAELDPQHWHITRPGAIVLTTRASFPQEVAPIVNTLLTSRKHELVSVCFHPHSPHLVATVALDALSCEQAAASFLGIVHDLVTGASTHSQ